MAQKQLHAMRQKEVVASTEGESSNSELVTATLSWDRERSEVESLRLEVQRYSDELKGVQRGTGDKGEEWGKRVRCAGIASLAGTKKGLFKECTQKAVKVLGMR